MNWSGCKPDGDDEHDQDHADEAGLDEAGSAIFKHQGSAHLPVV